jgi:acid phosphatase (class A)
MKKTVFVYILVLFGSVVSAQPKKLPPAWGHYKFLSSLNSSPVPGKADLDSLRFALSSSETRVTFIERVPGGPSADKKTPGSKCDPEACQPGEVVGNGKKRTPHYLATNEKFYIPDPPANSSEQTRAELDYLFQLQQRRSEEDVRASTYYAGVYYKTSTKPGDPDYERFRRNLFHIGRSIAPWFNADSLPVTAALVANVWKDAEYLIWKHKNYFLRIRPYKIDQRLNNTEETNWAAYPSGHATNSYTNAYLFSELLPEFSSFFIKDAYDMAHSREIIGVHYPSDSESGRILAYQVIQRLLKTEAFRNDLKASREEIERFAKRR